ncbi:MAG TPA: CU044_2847 family protein [Nocardioidaceae bacterium]|nr:CU044_2847 family protein [Nocardioidaceae bacterium]
MRRLVEFPLQDGGSVLVQVAEDGAGGGELTRGWGERRVVEQAQQSFDEAVDRVQPAVRALLARLRALADTPEEIQVEFGVQLSAEAGAFVAAASATANFRVSMTWRAQQDPMGGAPPGLAAG